MSGIIQLNDDFSWAPVSGYPPSGFIHPPSGTVWGFMSIASGTRGTMEIASGNIPSGTIGGDPDWGSGGVIFSAHSGSGNIPAGPPIMGGRLTTSFASGTIAGTPVSGSGPVHHIVRCHTCNKFDMFQWVTVATYSGHVATYCWDCAGYRYQKGGFLPVQKVYEEILRHGVSDVIGDDAPKEVIADRYEELGLPLIAQYLRNPFAGPITSSR